MINHRIMAYLLGMPVQITGGVRIRKVSQNSMCDYGYERYLAAVRQLCISESQLLGSQIELSPFDFVFAQLVHVSELTPEILFGLRAVTGIIPRVEPGSAKAILFGESKLDEQNYPEFQSVLRERHLLTAAEEEQDYNPSNAKAAALIARSKEINERLKKQKQAEDGDLTILDLISILAVQSRQSTEKIGEYDMYQLLDQQKRYKALDDYEVGIQAIMNGAKPDDIQLTHWIHSLDSKS